MGLDQSLGIKGSGQRIRRLARLYQQLIQSVTALTPQVPTIWVLEPLGPYIVGTWGVRAEWGGQYPDSRGV